jgi:formylglycine-generating enzyme required for sulfatase activity
VTLARGVRISRGPVTNAAWAPFAAAIGLPPPRGPGNHPVVDVSWEEARAYAAWMAAATGLKLRLPSEAEWEYAARAGAATAYPWGAGWDPARANGFDEDAGTGGRGTSPVGAFPPNAFGLLDMIGNVWEWTEDGWQEFHPFGPSDGAPRPEGPCGRRVLRGGSWRDVPRLLRVACRNRNGRDFRCDDYGFRLACDP